LYGSFIRDSPPASRRRTPTPLICSLTQLTSPRADKAINKDSRPLFSLPDPFSRPGNRYWTGFNAGIRTGHRSYPGRVDCWGQRKGVGSLNCPRAVEKRLPTPFNPLIYLNSPSGRGWEGALKSVWRIAYSFRTKRERRILKSLWLIAYSL